MTTWWWVRHGPTRETAFLGWRDVPADLSDRAALARLNAYLPSRALLVSSDLIRATATADALSHYRERLVPAPELREFNFGKWDGLDYETVAKRHPERSRQFWEHPGHVAPPGGESWHQVAERVGAFVERINRQFIGRDIVAVAHIGVIMTQIGVAQGQSPLLAIGQIIDNLSVTQTHWQAGRSTIGVINHKP